jgi:hypothetical protein
LHDETAETLQLLERRSIKGRFVMLAFSTTFDCEESSVCNRGTLAATVTVCETAPTASLTSTVLIAPV